MTFNEYSALEEAYADTCWENHRRDLDLIDKVVESYIELMKKFRKHKVIER